MKRRHGGGSDYHQQWCIRAPVTPPTWDWEAGFHTARRLWKCTVSTDPWWEAITWACGPRLSSLTSLKPGWQRRMPRPPTLSLPGWMEWGHSCSLWSLAEVERYYLKFPVFSDWPFSGPLNSECWLLLGLFLPIGISGLSASSVPSLEYIRQRENPEKSVLYHSLVFNVHFMSN